MRENIQITEKVVFEQKVEATKMTEKLPQKLVSIDLETGDAVLQCISFKDKYAKDKHIAAVDKFKADKVSIDSDIKTFKDKYDAAKPKLAGGGEMALRKSLKDEKDILDIRIRELKEPTIDRSEAMQTFSPVKIADTSVFDDLVTQITV